MNKCTQKSLFNSENLKLYLYLEKVTIEHHFKTLTRTISVDDECRTKDFQRNK